MARLQFRALSSAKLQGGKRKRAKRVTRELVSPLHFSRRPGQENKPSPRGPAVSVTHNASQPRQYPIFWQVTRFNQKSGTVNGCWLPHCRALSILISRVWLRFWIDENKKGEGNEKLMKKQRGKIRETMNGTEKRKRKNPRRDLEAVAIRHSQCLGGEKVVNFDPLFLVGKQQSALDKWTGKFMPLLYAVTFTNCGK